MNMKEVTNKFPYWPLQAAWDELNVNYTADNPGGPPLPLVDDGVGGTAVDIMLGIK